MTIRAGRDSRKSKMRFPASCTKRRLAGADANWSNGKSLNLADELILRLVIAGREVLVSCATNAPLKREHWRVRPFSPPPRWSLLGKMPWKLYAETRDQRVMRPSASERRGQALGSTVACKKHTRGRLRGRHHTLHTAHGRLGHLLKPNVQADAASANFVELDPAGTLALSVTKKAKCSRYQSIVRETAESRS